MKPAPHFWLRPKRNKAESCTYSQASCCPELFHRIKKEISVMMLLLAGFSTVAGQHLNYNIIRSGDTVGHLAITKTSAKNTVKYQATSKASTRFVMAVMVNTFEESVFENGRLIYSFLKRNINNKEAACKETRLENQEYHFYIAGMQSNPSMHETIQFNVISLYFSEPQSLQKIYSDAYQQWVSLERVSKGHYKLLMPDKDYNEYYYQNGICTRVVLHHKFYKAEFVLIQKKCNVNRP